MSYFAFDDLLAECLALGCGKGNFSYSCRRAAAKLRRLILGEHLPMCEDKLLLALRLRMANRSSENPEIEPFSEAEISEFFARIDTVEKAAAFVRAAAAIVDAPIGRSKAERSPRAHFGISRDDPAANLFEPTSASISGRRK